MAKEVILMDTVKDVGIAGDVVTVKDGFARNYLFPRKLAAPVTEATRRQLAKLTRDREAQAREAQAQAQATVEKLAGISVTLAMKTTDGEHLYGSVGAADIASSLKAQGFAIERDKIEVPENIKELGVFDVKIRLAAGAETTIKVWVVEE